jgi:hypothetical protein
MNKDNRNKIVLVVPDEVFKAVEAARGLVPRNSYVLHRLLIGMGREDLSHALRQAGRPKKIVENV